MSRRTSLLILGLGNVLLQDDGLGVTAVTKLIESYDRPDGVRILDGGTLGLSLLPAVEQADRLILVDAIQVDSAPGSFVRLTGDDVGPAVASRLSPHQVGVADLLDGVRWLDRYPSSVVLLGLVPESIDLGIGLSPAVQQQVPTLVERVVGEARALGFEFRPRTAAPAAGWYIPSVAPVSGAG
jgi:hydrogenase maturation protease